MLQPTARRITLKPNVGRDDKLAAHFRQFIHLLRVQHGACANQRFLTERLHHGRNAFFPLRRVERDFYRVESGVDNRTDVG